jgi:muconate cycloisomerase
VQLDEVRVHQIRLPLSGDFSHSRRGGLFADNIIVEIIGDQGNILGYGEGAPRPYVTGESQEIAARTVAEFIEGKPFPWELDDVCQIWDFVDGLPEGKKHRTAVCGIEMALLDVLSKGQNRSVIEYFPKDYYTNRVSYGASIPLGNKERILEICGIIRRLGIMNLRIKIGKDHKKNQESMALVREIFGEHCDLRIDVNGAWDHELAKKHINLIKDYGVKVIEQPMMPGDSNIKDFASEMQACGVMLMADESACSLKDVEEIIQERCYEMINVRLSKCGGFRNSLRIIELLRNNGDAFQIGCQLGESGVLSAAGRALSLLCGDAIYHDGSYDKFLLKENVTVEPVSFGWGGEAGPLDGVGLGITVNREKLERLNNGLSHVSIIRP